MYIGFDDSLSTLIITFHMAEKLTLCSLKLAYPSNAKEMPTSSSTSCTTSSYHSTAIEIPLGNSTLF